MSFARTNSDLRDKKTRNINFIRNSIFVFPTHHLGFVKRLFFFFQFYLFLYTDVKKKFQHEIDVAHLIIQIDLFFVLFSRSCLSSSIEQYLAYKRCIFFPIQTHTSQTKKCSTAKFTMCSKNILGQSDCFSNHEKSMNKRPNEFPNTETYKTRTFSFSKIVPFKKSYG